MLSINTINGQQRRAYDLFLWANDEMRNGNRIKASKIYKLYLKYNNIINY